MKTCLYCTGQIDEDDMYYMVTQLGPEFMSVLELKIKRESDVEDCLCEDCFAIIGEPNELIKIESTEDDNPVSNHVSAAPDQVEVIEKPELPKPEVSDEIYYRDEQDNYEEEQNNYENDKEQDNYENDEEQDTNESDEKEPNNYENDEEQDTNESDEKEPNNIYGERRKLEYNEVSSCIVCGKIARSRRFNLVPKSDRKRIATKIFPRQLTDESEICQMCLVQAQHNIKQSNFFEGPPSKIQCSNATILLPGYKRFSSNKQKCFVQGCTTNKKKKVIPKYLRRVLLESYKIYLPYEARACYEHVKEYYRDWSILKGMKSFNHFSSVHIKNMFDLMRDDEDV